MDLRAEIIGTNNLCTQFDKVHENLEKKILGILKTAGNPTLMEMRSLAPISKKGASEQRLASRVHDRGTLKRSIKIITSKGLGRYPTIWIKPVKTWGKDPDGWYAKFIEFGTRYHPAHPFIRPAYDHTKSQVEASLKNSIINEITQSFGSGIGKGRND